MSSYIAFNGWFAQIFEYYNLLADLTVFDRFGQQFGSRTFRDVDSARQFIESEFPGDFKEVDELE